MTELDLSAEPMFYQHVTDGLFDIMNHDSGFIIGIARKFCENPNRTLTKFLFKNMC